MTLYWLTPLADSFVNCDWYELVISIHTNEQDGEQTDSTVNFSDNSDLRRGFKASLRDFQDRGILRRTAERNRYVGKISAQPHTIVEQICFPNGKVLISSTVHVHKHREANINKNISRTFPATMPRLGTKKKEIILYNFA